MNVFVLKMIALICMVIDHIGYFIPDMSVAMRWIGRLSASIFIFCLCEGMDHTSSQKKYLQRLYLASVLMSVIQVTLKISANIFRTLFTIALLIAILKCRRENPKKGNRHLAAYLLWQAITLLIITYIYYRYNQTYLIKALIPSLVGSFAFAEGGIPFILLGLLLWLTKEDRKKMAAVYIVFCALYTLLSATPLTTQLYYAIRNTMLGTERMMKCIMLAFRTLAPAFMPGKTSGSLLTQKYQWMMVFALPLLMKYNGEKGKSLKWFFYVFYPAHLILLWGIRQLFI